MAYGIIENGVVTNAVEASAAFAKDRGWVELTGGAGIGWGYKDGAFSAPSAPPAPVAPIVTYKSDIWRRCTDEEAAILDNALDEAPVKMRRMWDDSTQVESTAPEFSELRRQMVLAFGEARTAEILAPSEV